MILGIVGGGLSGIVTAVAAKQLGFEVILIEASDYNTARGGEHIAADGVRELEHLGFPSEFFELSGTPCNEIFCYWGSDKAYLRNAIEIPNGMGFLLTRPAFDKVLANYTRSLGIKLFVNSRVTELKKHGQSWIVKLNDSGIPREIACDFIVDASGRNTKFPSTLGFKKYKYDKLHATNYHVSLSGNTASTMEGLIIVEPTEFGWVYFAGLRNGDGVLSIMTEHDKNLNYRYNEKKLGAFLENTEAGGFILPSIKSINNVVHHSCQTQICSNIIGDGWLLVGDSAWSADPLSAQGMLKAIQNGKEAARAIKCFYSNDNNGFAAYEEKIKMSFFQYLTERTKYYRKEERWKESEFWKKRQMSSWAERNITIDPTRKMDIHPKDLDRIVDNIVDLVPSINSTVLQSALMKPIEAHRAVDHYKKKSKYGITDIEIIVAIQEAHHLTRNA